MDSAWNRIRGGFLSPRQRAELMALHPTHNTCYASYREFTEAILEFLREHVPRRWPEFRSSVTGNFRVIDPKDFRVPT